MHGGGNEATRGAAALGDWPSEFGIEGGIRCSHFAESLFSSGPGGSHSGNQDGNKNGISPLPALAFIRRLPVKSNGSKSRQIRGAKAHKAENLRPHLKECLITSWLHSKESITLFDPCRKKKRESNLS
jgi:hypothetical protein